MRALLLSLLLLNLALFFLLRGMFGALPSAGHAPAMACCRGCARS